MKFDYCGEQTFNESIEIESVGNVAIRASGVSGNEYDIVIITKNDGRTYVIQVYNCTNDSDIIIGSSSSISISTMFYDDNYLRKTIKKFLNSADIIQAEEVPIDEILNNLKNPLEFIEEINNG